MNQASAVFMARSWKDLPLPGFLNPLSQDKEKPRKSMNLQGYTLYEVVSRGNAALMLLI